MITLPDNARRELEQLAEDLEGWPQPGQSTHLVTLGDRAALAVKSLALAQQLRREQPPEQIAQADAVVVFCQTEADQRRGRQQGWLIRALDSIGDMGSGELSVRAEDAAEVKRASQCQAERITRDQVCAALSIAKSYLRNKLSEANKQGDPAPAESGRAWHYSEMQPWLRRRFPDKSFLFPRDYADFVRQSKLSSM